MRTVIAIAVLLWFLSGGVVAIAGASEYRICPGDVLAIDVWGFPEFHAKDATVGGGQEATTAGMITVRPDGQIAFPLVGEVMAAGASPAELTFALTKALREYIKDPKVTVNITKYHTTRVYVLGEVIRPGLYEIEKQHYLLDAIGLAGGYSKNAAKKNIFIIHKDNTGEPVKVNLLSLLKKGDMSQNYLLADGDVVYLTENGRIDFATDIVPLFTAAYYFNGTK